MLPRIINECREQHRPPRRQRHRCKPLVQVADMPGLSVLVFFASSINRFQGQCNLDQFFSGFFRRSHYFWSGSTANESWASDAWAEESFGNGDSPLANSPAKS